MCGICGKMNFEQDDSVYPALIRVDAGYDTSSGSGRSGSLCRSPQVGLGHRRLSIIDLSRGHQPLSNEDGSVWIVFNGEIYNYQELRAFLLEQGHVFKTQSDTETIVHLYEEFGPGMPGEAARHVCFRHLGREQEDSFPGKGSGWNKAPLLLLD